MKYSISILLFLIFSINITGQILQTKIDLKNTSLTSQSSTLNNNISAYAIDENHEIYRSSITKQSLNSWWEIDLQSIYSINGIKINFLSNNQNVIVVFSAIPIFNNNSSENEINITIQDIITNSSDFYYLSINNLSQNNDIIETIPLYAQYIGIATTDGGNIGLTEVEVFGPTGNPEIGIDPSGPDWVGPDLSHSGESNCMDGIDNDGNGQIDCDDSNCKVKYSKIWYKEPTCPICIDGEICIYGSGVDQISLDGGVNWVNFVDGQCFTVGDGVYNIILKSKGGCTVSETIEFSSPVGSRLNGCANGDFELGTFENWTGGIDLNESNPNGPHVFDNKDINEPVHRIISTSSFFDPLIHHIHALEPGKGLYFARLGDPATIGDINNQISQQERLTYCLDVTEDNADFSFIYAQVIEDPNHPFVEQPYFFFRAYDSDNNTIYQKVTAANDPYLAEIPLSIIKYKGWTCEAIDFTEYIGEEVCIEFVNSDCGNYEHWGYVYIDELCSAPSDHTPIADIEFESEFICENQILQISAPPGLYNEFSWTISKVASNGSEIETLTTPFEIGYSTKIEDVKEFYESNTNFIVNCGDKIKVTLDVTNFCASASSSEIFEFLCNTYNIDYCDPMIICATTESIQFKGQNDCDDCTYSWSPQSRLIDSNVKFPTVNAQTFFDSYSKTYNGVITTPEGCVYNEIVTFDLTGFDLDIAELDIGYCSYNTTGTITLSSDYFLLLNENITVTATNTITNVKEELEVEGIGLERTFYFEKERVYDTEFLIHVEVEFGLECSDEVSCAQSIMLDKVNQSNFSAYWKAAYPNFFGANAQNPNNQVFNIFFSSLTETTSGNEDCDDMNNTASSIYFYRLQFFDHVASEVFDQQISKSIFDTQGINGFEITWDGKFNGQYVAPGVYYGLVTIQSCFSGDFQCTDCGPKPLPFQYCRGVNNSIARMGTPGGQETDNPDLWHFTVYFDGGNN